MLLYLLVKNRDKKNFLLDKNLSNIRIEKKIFHHNIDTQKFTKILFNNKNHLDIRIFKIHILNNKTFQIINNNKIFKTNHCHQNTLVKNTHKWANNSHL